jgi:hypothetical protein
MSQGLSISKPIWITIWTVAMFQTLVGTVVRTETWKIDIQFPGIMVALYLQWFLGPIAMMFGASGGIFLAAATILTNVLIYAALVSLTLLVYRIFKRT